MNASALCSENPKKKSDHFTILWDQGDLPTNTQTHIPTIEGLPKDHFKMKI